MKMLEYGHYRLVKEAAEPSGHVYWCMYYIVHNWGEREYHFINLKESLEEALEWIRRNR